MSLHVPLFASQTQGSSSESGSDGLERRVSSAADLRTQEAAQTLLSKQRALLDDFNLSGADQIPAIVIDVNATTRAITSCVQSVLGVVSGVKGVAVAAMGVVIAPLQVAQGGLLVALGMKLAKEDLESMQHLSDPQDIKVANLNLQNHISLVVLGVLFLVAGVIGAAAMAAGYAGLAAIGISAMGVAGTLVGGLLSLVCIARGALLIYRSILSLNELNACEKKVNQQDFIDEVAPKTEVERDWIHCERLIGKEATEALKKVDAGEIHLKEIKGIIRKGIYEQKLKQKIMFGIGILMVLGGLAGSVGAGFAAASGVGHIAGVGVTAALAASIAANGLFATMEALWVPVDSTKAFKFIEQRMNPHKDEKSLSEVEFKCQLEKALKRMQSVNREAWEKYEPKSFGPKEIFYDGNQYNARGLARMLHYDHHTIPFELIGWAASEEFSESILLRLGGSLTCEKESIFFMKNKSTGIVTSTHTLCVTNEQGFSQKLKAEIAMDPSKPVQDKYPIKIILV